ncbi:hypothetical protein [Azotobacter vinelandii]
MRGLIIGGMLTCVTLGAAAADGSIFGTHRTKFQPVQIGGVLQGCEITFVTVIADHVYLKGNHVAVNGSVLLQGNEAGGLALILRVGLMDITLGAQFERPEFAYLQTANFSTAEANHQSFDGEEGYKLFVYNALDTSIANALGELVSAGNVSIGYNRKIGGRDVLVPLDLMVVDSEYTTDQKVLRKRSPDTMLGFLDCTEKVMNRTLEKLK